MDVILYENTMAREDVRIVIMEVDLAAIAAREAACEGVGWRLSRDNAGNAQWLIVDGLGTEHPAQVDCDQVPAPVGDVEFVASSRTDIRYLLSMLQDETLADAECLAEIARRAAAATSPPWRGYDLDRVRGESIISLPADRDPDMYLSKGTRSISGASYVFVAHARQEVLILLGLAYKALLRQRMPDFLRGPHLDVTRDDSENGRAK